jgi:demethylmenaquinone methyltransferase/2-methoxy-6-polyprenyl-1,4-benzoquinol methylase
MSALAPPNEKSQFVRSLFSAIAQRYDLANHLLSGGLDFFWRRRAAAIVRRRQPRRILDLATGSGDLARTICATCPESLVVGADFCHPMLRVAQRKGLTHLITADALQLPFTDAAFDVLTVAFGLRNMASWSGALAEMRRVLRPGGLVLILDFSVPPAPLRWAYRPYLHLVLPRLAGLLTGEKAAYDYLGDSIEKFPQGEEMGLLLKKAGFEQPNSEPLSGGIVSLYTAVRPAD